jgi:histidinol-phosphate/aromatic aminotransferase/cobyric acid decarboxylase-like protein
VIVPRRELRGVPRSLHGGQEDACAPPIRIDFSTGINAYGPAAAVVDAIRDAAPDRYPDPEALAPRRAAAERWGVPLDCVAFGAGATELIYAACQAYIRSGDTVVVPRPAFAEYARAALLAGARVRGAPSHRGPRIAAAHDATVGRPFLQAIHKIRPRIAFLAAPTSPAGRAIPREELRRIADACAQCDTLLVLDQSYDAFTPDPLGTPALPGHPAVVHLRSITKDHAIAGVRAGFAVGPERVIAAIERARAPWATSTLAQAASAAALSPAADVHVASTIARLRTGAAELAAACTAMGMRAVPSDTHYFLSHVGDGARLRSRLIAEYRLGVRDCTSFELPAYVRIAARTEPENATLVRALTRLEWAVRT